MSLQLPEGLIQHLAGGNAPPPLPEGLQGPDDYSESSDPLKVLQDCIESLPKVIAALPDPQDTQDAIQALHILAKIQTRLSGKQAASGPQAG